MKKLMLFLTFLFLIGTLQVANAAGSPTNLQAAILKPAWTIHGHIGKHSHRSHHHRVIIRFRGIPYYYATGVFYRKIGKQYKTVRPEIGMIVATLPDSGVKIIDTEKGTRFIYDGIIYKQVPSKRKIKYEVVGFIK